MLPLMAGFFRAITICYLHLASKCSVKINGAKINIVVKITIIFPNNDVATNGGRILTSTVVRYSSFFSKRSIGIDGTRINVPIAVAIILPNNGVARDSRVLLISAIAGYLLLRDRKSVV